MLWEVSSRDEGKWKKGCDCNWKYQYIIISFNSPNKIVLKTTLKASVGLSSFGKKWQFWRVDFMVYLGIIPLWRSFPPQSTQSPETTPEFSSTELANPIRTFAHGISNKQAYMQETLVLDLSGVVFAAAGQEMDLPFWLLGGIL